MSDVAEIEVPAEDSVTTQVRSRLRELTLPLREQLAEIDRRLIGLNRERDDLLLAKREITKTIDHLEPTQAKANGGTAGLAVASYTKKRNAVDEYVKQNRAKLAKGFTAAELAHKMKDEGIQPVMSPEMTRKITKDLHQAGLLRADRIVKGGGQLYVPVGK